MKDFRQIIDCWPNRDEMAADLGLSKRWAVDKWWRRNSIPADYWSAIVTAAAKRGHRDITIERMAQMRSAA